MIKIQQSRLARCEAGQASIEFALTVMMTLLLIFGLIDFGRAIYTASLVQWAAQSGAREAIIDSSDEAITAAVKDRLAGLDTNTMPDPVVSWTGNVVQVQVSYRFEFVAPIVAQIVGDNIEINASASMIAH